MTMMMAPPPTAMPAPVHLVDRLVEVGGVVNGEAIRGRGHARRHAGKADAQRHRRSDDDCTHWNSPWILERRRPRASHVLTIDSRSRAVRVSASGTASYRPVLRRQTPLTKT